MLQKRLPEGGDERSEIVQWTISAKNARPVGGPGGRRCPAALARLDSGRVKTQRTLWDEDGGSAWGSRVGATDRLVQNLEYGGGLAPTLHGACPLTKAHLNKCTVKMKLHRSLLRVRCHLQIFCERTIHSRIWIGPDR